MSGMIWTPLHLRFVSPHVLHVFGRCLDLSRGGGCGRGAGDPAGRAAGDGCRVDRWGWRGMEELEGDWRRMK